MVAGTDSTSFSRKLNDGEASCWVSWVSTFIAERDYEAITRTSTTLMASAQNLLTGVKTVTMTMTQCVGGDQWIAKDRLKRTISWRTFREHSEQRRTLVTVIVCCPVDGGGGGDDERVCCQTRAGTVLFLSIGND